MTNPYAYWKAALAGEKPKMFVDDPMPGFYRKGVYEKRENKARKRVGWEPVAIFLNGANLAAVIGSANHVTDRDKINELWSYCAGNPISEETYRAVAERGEQWPDSHEEKPKRDPAAEAANEQAFIAEDDRRNSAPVPATTSPETVIVDGIAKASEQLAKYAAIDSDEMSSKARSLQQRLLDLRGEAKHHYETLNEPLLKEQKRIREIWFPLRDQADEAAGKLRTAMGAWEDEKRKAAKLAQEAADKAAHEHAEKVRAAEKANEPPPPAPEPAKTNVPPPAAQIRGGAGRAASVSVAMFVTAIDNEKVFQQFKGNPEITALLMTLAQKAVRAGIQVPGATVEERSVVQ